MPDSCAYSACLAITETVCRKAERQKNEGVQIEMPVMIYTALDCSIEDTMEKNFFRSGATVAFVNDNVRYGGEVIPVDFCSQQIT